MKKNVLWLAVPIVVFIYSLGLLQFAEYKNSAKGSPLAEQVLYTNKYVVRLYRDKVAVFVGNDTIPVKYLNVKLENLREYDKNVLERGIVLDSLKEVLLLEEDFSS